MSLLDACHFELQKREDGRASVSSLHNLFTKAIFFNYVEVSAEVKGQGIFKWLSFGGVSIVCQVLGGKKAIQNLPFLAVILCYCGN